MMIRLLCRLSLICALVAVLGGCATGRHDTWIGENVGVTVDSFDTPSRTSEQK